MSTYCVANLLYSITSEYHPETLSPAVREGRCGHLIAGRYPRNFTAAEALRRRRQWFTDPDMPYFITHVVPARYVSAQVASPRPRGGVGTGGLGSREVTGAGER